MNRKLKYHNRQNIPVKKWLPVAHSTPDISHERNKKPDISRGLFAGSFGILNGEVT